MEEFIIRAAERILGVFIGGFAIYLGYRLFIKLPEQMDSSGKVVLPGGVSIFLSRIGPGIFFSLFGASIVALSLYQRLEIEIPAAAPGEPLQTATANQTRSIRYFGDASQSNNDERLAAMRSEANRTLYELNRLSQVLVADLPASKRNDINQAIRESKLALVYSVWGKDWGDFAQFKRWIAQGESVPAPASFDVAAIELFRNGQTEQSP
jgi:hypothetical protein